VKVIEKFLGTLRVQNYSEHTISGYRRWLEEFVGFVGEEKDPAKSSSDDVLAYMSSMTDRSANTRKAIYIALRSFFSYLLDTGVISRPVSVPAVKVDRTVVKVLSTESIKRILNKISGTTIRDYRDRALITLMYVTGMRVSEITDLKTSDISSYKQVRSSRDRNVKRLRVTVRGKGLKEREIYVNDISAGILFEYLLKREDDSEFIFSNHDSRNPSGRLTAGGIRRILHRRAAAARVRADIHPHLFRHSIATHMLESGVNVFVLQKFLGHESLESTKKYITFLDHDYRSVCEDSIKNILYKRSESGRHGQDSAGSS
jgi:site-specific recombinase XerD